MDFPMGKDTQISPTVRKEIHRIQIKTGIDVPERQGRPNREQTDAIPFHELLTHQRRITLRATPCQTRARCITTQQGTINPLTRERKGTHTGIPHKQDIIMNKGRLQSE